MRLALSALCEDPTHRTGLTTFFHEFVGRSLDLPGDLEWIVYAGPGQDWAVRSPRVQVVRSYPANDRIARRLWADHFLVPADARRRGADALLTVGFVPVSDRLPTVLHLLSLQHLDRSNRVGLARRIYRGLLMGRFVRRAGLIITNSQFAAGKIRAAYPAAERLLVSPEGLQHEQFQPVAAPDEASRLRAKYDLEPGYLIWVSNFYSYKQAPLLLAAYARLDADLRRRHSLIMAGGNWQQGIDAARAQADALGIGGDVRFLGWIDDADLAPLYRQARASVLSSREETFGRCVVEAMACGTPCVVNDIAVMREVTGGHALLVDFQDTVAAAGALDTILRDDSRHVELRAAGIEWTQRFSFERQATERIGAIRTLLGQEPVAASSSRSADATGG